MSHLALLLVLVMLTLLHQCQCFVNHQDSTSGKMVPIKELNQPRNYPPVYHQNPLNPVKRVPARVPRGPEHLVRGLFGRCYSGVFGHYEYRLCPFDNATQRDVSFQMLAIYHGVIGVYNGWLSHNGTLAAMSLPNGDPCLSGPSRYRGTLVRFQCASSNVTSLLSVHESPVCQYRMVLGTPLVCHQHALLAYPYLARLETDYRTAWDAAYTLRLRGVINDSSYTQLVDNLLFQAGLLDDTQQLESAAPTTMTTEAKTLSGNGQSVTVVTEDGAQAMKHLAQQILDIQRQVRLQEGRPP